MFQIFGNLDIGKYKMPTLNISFLHFPRTGRDLGLARDVYLTNHYHASSRGPVPIRWMAPESIFDREFTSASDVWSFGVVLWEIVTLAEHPFPGLSNEEVLSHVKRGKNELVAPKPTSL